MSVLAADGVGLAVLAALLGLTAACAPQAALTATQWAIGAALAIAASLFLWRHRFGPREVAGWVWLAGLSVLLALMFWGADIGLELIRPPGSRRHDAASTVAGLELWMLLCPGLTSVALAGLARCLSLARRA